MFWPCETRTSTCRSFATISSGLYRFLAIPVLLDVKDIPQVGPLQWGWISDHDLVLILARDSEEETVGRARTKSGQLRGTRRASEPKDQRWRRRGIADT